MFYVYILKSISCGKYYVGYTSNLEERLESHNSGLQRWTRNKGPWNMVYSERLVTKREAIIREKQLKNKKSRKSLEILISKINNQGG